MMCTPLRSRLRSKRGGVFKSAVALLAFTGAAGALAWMLVAPDALQIELETRTGFPVETGSLAVNPLGISVSGKDLTVGNPGTFGGGDAMLQIERMEASASLPSALRGEVWINDLEIHLSRAVLVTDERGRLNLDVFAERLFVDPGTGAAQTFFAERVRLVVDEVVFVDNTQMIPSRRSIRALLDTERADLDQAREIFAPLYDLAAGVGSLPVR